MCLNVWRRVTLTVNTPNLKETAGLTEFGELLLLLQLSSWPTSGCSHLELHSPHAPGDNDGVELTDGRRPDQILMVY